MKVSMCDVCLRNAKLSQAIMIQTFKSGVESLKFDLCVEHKTFFKDCKTLITAQEKYNTMQRVAFSNAA